MEEKTLEETLLEIVKDPSKMTYETYTDFANYKKERRMKMLTIAGSAAAVVGLGIAIGLGGYLGGLLGSTALSISGLLGGTAVATAGAVTSTLAMSRYGKYDEYASDLRKFKRKHSKDFKQLKTIMLQYSKSLKFAEENLDAASNKETSKQIDLKNAEENLDDTLSLSAQVDYLKAKRNAAKATKKREEAEAAVEAVQERKMGKKGGVKGKGKTSATGRTVGGTNRYQSSKKSARKRRKVKEELNNEEDSSLTL